MSVDDIMGGPLARTLDDYPVPSLSAGFAERVVAAAEARAEPLPELRRAGRGPRWQLGRRLAIGAACFGALATAAAATGVLEQFDIPVPSPQKVWASLTSKETSAAATAAPMMHNSTADFDTTALAPVVIEGPIDTPEELGEAFRRIDEVRRGRIDARRELAGQRIDGAIERRREAGLPVPTPEQEARLRQRIDEAQALRQQRADQRIAARRAELERKVENGEALTRDDVAAARRADPATSERRERLMQLRQMSPQQRRETLRSMAPEQRRALIEEYRARRGAAANDTFPALTETPADDVGVEAAPEFAPPQP